MYGECRDRMGDVIYGAHYCFPLQKLLYKSAFDNFICKRDCQMQNKQDKQNNTPNHALMKHSWCICTKLIPEIKLYALHSATKAKDLLWSPQYHDYGYSWGNQELFFFTVQMYKHWCIGTFSNWSELSRSSVATIEYQLLERKEQKWTQNI